MDILHADFLLGATKAEHFPKITPQMLPEVAFIGRSNVGKSSLLNSLVRRKNLAHVSNTPGKTQQINFFNVENMWTFVDLPGFGYAKAPQTERAAWKRLADEYLGKREPLKLVCFLVDIRHDPSKPELAMIEELEGWGRKYAIVLTKKDKISPKAALERQEQLQDVTQFCAGCVDVLPYSSETNEARPNLLAIIKRACSSEGSSSQQKNLG